MRNVMFKMFDRVLLANGLEADVLEVFGDGDAYLVEWATPGGPHRYEDDVVGPDAIARLLHAYIDSDHGA